MKREEINNKYIGPALDAKRDGNIEKAISILEDGIRQTNGDGHIIMELAELFFSSGQLKKAAELFRVAEFRLPHKSDRKLSYDRSFASMLKLQTERMPRGGWCGFSKEPYPPIIGRPVAVLGGVKLSGLFDIYDYSIELDTNPISILTGPNGSGKSSILKMISALYHWDLESIARIKFRMSEFRYKEYRPPYYKHDKSTDKFEVVQEVHEMSTIKIERRVLKKSRMPATIAVQLIVSLVNPMGRTQHKAYQNFHFSKTKNIHSNDNRLSDEKNNLSNLTPNKLSIKKEPDWLTAYLCFRGALFLESNRLQKVVQDAFPRLSISTESKLAISEYSEFLQYILSNDYLDNWTRSKGNFQKRIDLMCEIINKRFVNKELSINAKSGFCIKDRFGNIIAPEELSSGEQNLINLFFTMLFNADYLARGDFNEASFIMIDEPELSLHVAWQSDFISDIEKVAQIALGKYIIATHSPSIINNHWDLVTELGENTK